MRIAVSEHCLPGPEAARWGRARELGVDGLELVVGPYGTGRHPLWRAEGPRTVRHGAEQAGLALASVVAGFFLAPSLGLLETPSRHQLAQNLARLLRTAAEAGSPVVVVPLLGEAEPLNEPLTSALVDLLGAAARDAAQLGLRLALQTALPANRLQALLAQLSEPAVAIAYDSGLARSVGQDPVADLKLLAGDVIQLRLSDVAANGHRVPLGQGVCRLSAVVRQMQALPQRPWAVLGPTEGPNREEAVAPGLAWLRALDARQSLAGAGH